MATGGHLHGTPRNNRRQCFGTNLPLGPGRTAWRSTFARLSLFPGQQLPFRGEVVLDRLNVVRRLDLAPDELWRDFEHKVRKNVNCAKRSALTVEVDPSGRRIDDFLAVYYATLQRRAASDSYFFSRDFFQRLIRDLAGQFVFFHVLDGGRVVSTELVLLSADQMYSFSAAR